jgi:hypothetical protein
MTEAKLKLRHRVDVKKEARLGQSPSATGNAYVAEEADAASR